MVARVTHVLVAIAAAFFLALGVFALLRPAAVLAPFGVAVGTADGRSEVSAVYGGFGLAMAVLLALAVPDPAAHRGELLAVAVALFGMAAGRIVARLRDRPRAFYPVWFFFWVEIAAGALLLLAR